MSAGLPELGLAEGIAEPADPICRHSIGFYLHQAFEAARFMAAGCGWACGFEVRKAWRSSREMASASMFETPGTCYATKEKSK